MTVARGTVSVSMSDRNYSGQNPSATFPPQLGDPPPEIQVFDADLHSAAVGDDDELTKPTFIGPGCTKELTITVDRAAGDLPTPTGYPAYDQSVRHWMMQLTFNNVPGVSFRDPNDNPIEANPTTHEPLRSMKWGWKCASRTRTTRCHGGGTRLTVRWARASRRPARSSWAPQGKGPQRPCT